MFAPVVPRGRGAPNQHPVDVLRTKLWSRVVRLVSGLSSSYAIELEIDPELVHKKSAGVVRPRKWDAYEKGTKVPKRIKGKRDAVAMAEARYPGTQRYFDSPMWAVLRREKLTASEVDWQLRTLELSVVEVLLEEAILEGESRRRFRAFDADVASRIVALSTFDSLVAVVLLVAKSEAIGSIELRERALACYQQMQNPISRLPEVDPWDAELFRLIDTTCRHWVFPTPNDRMEVIIFSRRIGAPPE